MIFIKKYVYHLYVILKKPFDVRVGKLKIKLFPKGQIAEALFVADFEREQLELFCRCISDAKFFIDAGCNIGLYSLLASTGMSSRARILSFEPSSSTVELLKANLQLNRINNVTLITKALSNVDDKVLTMYQNTNEGDGERFVLPTKKNTGAAVTFESVSTITLDSVVSEIGIDSDFKCVYKIDVEGWEMNVLLGSLKFLRNTTKVVLLFENSNIGLKRAGSSQDKLYSLLENLGYKLYVPDIRGHVWSTNSSTIQGSGNVWATKNKKLLPAI